MKIEAHQTQKGYTLIELLLYVAIVGTMLTLIVTFFGMSATARVKNETIAEVDDQGTYIMDYITSTIRNASSISSPAAGSNGSSLSLVVPTGSLSPTTFTLSGSSLQVTQGTNPAEALSDSLVQVTNLKFSNLTPSATPGNVQVSFTLARLNPNNRTEYSYQQTFTSSAEVSW